MSLLDQFTKISGQDPLKRLVDEATKALDKKLENSVTDLFATALKEVGISTTITNELASKFGDSFQQGAADKFFRTATTAIDRVTDSDIASNIFPKYAKTSTSEVKRLSNSVVNFSGTNTKAALQFPNQLGKYYAALNFRSYTRTAPQAPAKMEFTDSIFLPIPHNLDESFDIKINTTETGMVGFVADMLQAEDAYQKTGQGGSYFTTGGGLGSQGIAATYLLGTTLLGGAGLKIGSKNIGVGDVGKGVIGQVAKAVPNPHMAAFFEGVNMRQFSFDWSFAPRNESESAILVEIINKLKIHSLPTFSQAGQAAFTYPDLCVVELHPWAQSEGNELIKYKPALINNVSVSYAPNGPSFFAGTTLPTFVKLQITFQETEYFTGEDFGGERRSDLLSKSGKALLEAFNIDTSLIEDDVNANIIENTNSDIIQRAQSESSLVVEGAKPYQTALNQVSDIAPGTNPVEISTFTIDDNIQKISVGRASTSGNMINTDNGTQYVESSKYYIISEKPSSGSSFVDKYTTLEETLKGLEETKAISK